MKKFIITLCLSAFCLTGFSANINPGDGKSMTGGKKARYHVHKKRPNKVGKGFGKGGSKYRKYHNTQGPQPKK